MDRSALTRLQERESDDLMRVSPVAFHAKKHDGPKTRMASGAGWAAGSGGRSALDLSSSRRAGAFHDTAEHLPERDPAVLGRAPKFNLQQESCNRRQCRASGKRRYCARMSRPSALWHTDSRCCSLIRRHALFLGATVPPWVMHL